MSKVIVIDDEPFILMMIEDKLKKANIGVVTLRKSKDAMAVIKKEMPDLIILDWMMPELSGIELCRMLEEAPDMLHIPIFKGQDADEQLGLRCGVTRYITKPFSPKILLEMVQEVIGNAGD
jgi:DNA-binding response OmpR family regulator